MSWLTIIFAQSVGTALKPAAEAVGGFGSEAASEAFSARGADLGFGADFGFADAFGFGADRGAVLGFGAAFGVTSSAFAASLVSAFGVAFVVFFVSAIGI
jgi:hypothetical protein